MSHVQRYPVDVTTDGSGNASGATPPVTGRIQTIVYVKDATTPFAAGVDFTITLEKTGENVWTEANVNASAVRAPRQPTHNQDGTAVLHAAGGTPVNDHIVVDNDRILIGIAQGGAAKLGRFYILMA